MNDPACECNRRVTRSAPSCWMGDDAIAALRVRHAQVRAASGLPPIKPTARGARRNGGESPGTTRLSPGRRRERAALSPEEAITPRRDAHEALLAELQRAPGLMHVGQISPGLTSRNYAAQMEFHDQGKAAIRETIGLRAAASHRRLAGQREAKRDPARAYSGLGGLVTGHRSSLKRSPPRRLDALANSPVPDNIVPLAKGDEVRVREEGEESGEAGETSMTGVVQAIWQWRRQTLVVDGVVMPAPRIREVLVRFDVGAQWFSEDKLDLIRHPSVEELRSSIKGLDPDLTTTLGRSLLAQIQSGPDGKGVGEDGAFMPAPDDPPDKLLISELVAGKSPPRKKQGVHREASRAAGESVLTPMERRMFQAVMQQGSLNCLRFARILQLASPHNHAVCSFLHASC